jgi:hypothetical protein
VVAVGLVIQHPRSRWRTQALRGCSCSLSPSPSLPNPPPPNKHPPPYPPLSPKPSATQPIVKLRSTLFSRASQKRPPSPPFPAGNWLVPEADGFATVYGTSEWQGLTHLAGSTPAGSLPCFYDSREKFVYFGLAQQSTAGPSPLLSRSKF